MKKFLTALPLILALSSCQTAINSKAAKSESNANDTSKVIVANYQGGKVTLRDANEEITKLATQNAKLKGVSFYQLTADQKETIIKEAVLKEMSYKEAKRRNLNKDKDYQEALKLFESELLKQKLFIALAKDAGDEKNVRKNYDELVAKLKDKKDIRISYITVKTQNEAEALYQSLSKSPNSFSAVAKKKSLDKETGKKGGDLGFVMEDALPVEVIKQARSVNKGEIAKPMKNGDKWLVIKLEDERPAEITPFDKSKDALAQNLAKKAIEDFVSQSFEKANITMVVK